MIRWGNIFAYPVLRSILLWQVIVVVFGLGTLYLAMFLVLTANTTMTLEKQRQHVIYNLSSHQEKWRSWKLMGMESSLDEALAKFKDLHRLKSIEVVPSSQISPAESDYDIFYPEVDDGLLGYVIHARLPSVHMDAIYNTNWILSILLISLGAVFIGCNVFFARLIKRKIYNPILDLNQAFSQLGDGNKLQTENIAAAGEMKDFLSNIQTLYNDKCESDRLSAIGEITSQVAHDIRSPLVALSVAVKHTDSLPEENRLLLRSAIERIEDIVSNLKSTNENARNAVRSRQLIPSLISSMVSEKRTQYKNSNTSLHWELDRESYGVFAEVNPISFKRSISNILDNAFESMSDTGWVRVELKRKEKELQVVISDSGRGISETDLPRVVEKGVTVSKVGGTGLGLSYAHEQVKSWGGNLRIESQQGLGTQVYITLPLTSPPKWFVESIDLETDTTVFVLDDDANIHKVWQKRLNLPSLQFVSVKNTQAFINEFQKAKNSHRHHLLLCDYEIVKESRTGLDVIRQLGEESHSILVTSRHESREIQKKCEKFGVKLLPKPLAGVVPITYASS